MAAGGAVDVRDRLIAAGAPEVCPAAVVIAAETRREEQRLGTLSDLPALIAGAEGSAMLLLDWPKGPGAGSCAARAQVHLSLRERSVHAV